MLILHIYRSWADVRRGQVPGAHRLAGEPPGLTGHEQSRRAGFPGPTFRPGLEASVPGDRTWRLQPVAGPGVLTHGGLCRVRVTSQDMHICLPAPPHSLGSGAPVPICPPPSQVMPLGCGDEATGAVKDPWSGSRSVGKEREGGRERGVGRREGKGGEEREAPAPPPPEAVQAQRSWGKHRQPAVGAWRCHRPEAAPPSCTLGPSARRPPSGPLSPGSPGHAPPSGREPWSPGSPRALCSGPGTGSAEPPKPEHKVTPPGHGWRAPGSRL